ncbi:hypothetical protein [Frankia sp. CiP1_Cm_nod1]|uniref:hypothetical protein n=1 Tax=Frankia sp. CiP1_Cm_nod1 TaxID=2897160 RepID=UPI00202453E6
MAAHHEMVAVFEESALTAVKLNSLTAVSARSCADHNTFSPCRPGAVVTFRRRRNEDTQDVRLE